jgi:uncharacterized protein
MQTDVMRILFLHGLESTLSEEKREILSKYGEVIAPAIDYTKNPNIIEDFTTKYKDNVPDLVIGSSLGGFVAFYLANRLRIPALLFNPALPYRSVVQEFPEELEPFEKPVSLVMGQLDPIIKPSDTLTFLREHQLTELPVRTTIRPQLEHRIPVDEFELAITEFTSLMH